MRGIIEMQLWTYQWDNTNINDKIRDDGKPDARVFTKGVYDEEAIDPKNGSTGSYTHHKQVDVDAGNASE